ncbi:adenine-specific DNA methyltransferase (EcoRI methylase domain) [Campylobacter iguaniorum]|uniref:adenine-specific methyltransferase EcoRI family protein n=1 Tax=Campylobacter iguaniorum TaxID=1244531 RepID=UPI0007C95BEF|nr:adenine-specific methyltransferase EcoRI family protein [Campylobacter iguaniorum]ANE35637.1 adenine-specific DNA methyltransferase (EcoRI methylase domain) [Campylobacter iguaniorum]
MGGNSNLQDSRNARADEFYTPLSLIENELKNYKKQFEGKTILCNCDDPRVSNFFRYFVMQFESLGLKKVIATCYKNNNPDLFSTEETEKAVYLEYDGSIKYSREEDFEKIPCKELKGNGDYKSSECIKFLDESDIVCTNPPFSKMKNFLPFLMEKNKKFLILGNLNHATWVETFPYFFENKVWCGYTDGHFWFQVPDSYEEKSTDYKMVDGIKYRRMGNICWFTNLEVAKRHEILETGKKFNPENYQKYDSYDAIDIGKNVDIPMDYDGVMGVPITFLTKHNPEQFKLIGELHTGKGNPYDFAFPKVNGKNKYVRLLIQRRK